jgi:hypothetical protein
MKYTGEEYPNATFPIAETKRELLALLEGVGDDVPIFMADEDDNLCHLVVIVDLDQPDSPFVHLDPAKPAF